MKFIYFLPFLLLSITGFAQFNLPVDFQSSTITYVLTDFGGNMSLVVADPTDITNNVAQSTKTNTAELWAGTTMGPAEGFDAAIPFAANQTRITVRVWSPDAGIPVRLKVEDSADPAISVETEANTTVAMEWETLEFDFNNEVADTPPLDLANSYDKASIFFNFGTTGADAGEKTYYWDDVELAPAAFTVFDIIANSPDHMTLETAVIAAGLDNALIAAGPFTVFAPTDAAFDALPPGALDALLADPTGELAQVLLYHVLVGEVLSTDLINGQMTATVQGADITVMIDGGNVFINDALVTVADLQADNGVVHVIDAVLLPPAQVDLPITFEDPDLDYNLADFGGNASSIVVDPTDPTNRVGQAIRAADAATFAGTTMGADGLANPIPFTSSQTQMSVRVWSPEAGIPVRLKVEDATNPGISVETEANTTVAMSWETLEFDFSNEAMGTAAIN